MYLALYRKYRPRTFDDVISQEHITTTLKNQVKNNCTGHAYLFTGSRGTGKTTCAKILSMAVNCDNPENGSPCMKCPNCREIMEGSATDVLEMDAASNRGVEDVRRLREEVSYTPVSCKYRVYIIDEVHMLTTEAFNALLKTLEEPPPHVKFILATTELHKVPATISSRCQRFEFRRVDVNDSAGRLMEVAAKEGFSLDKEAAVLISRLSDGGMRDALSVLDRCASSDDHVTVGVVRDCAGIADNHHLYEFSEMVARRDTAGCLRLLGELHSSSKDIALIINNLIEHFRDLMVYKSAPNEGDLLTALPDEHGRVAEIAGMYSMGEVLSCLSILSDCADNIGRAKQRKTLAEMCFVKMCARGGQALEAQYADIAPAPKPQTAAQIPQIGAAAQPPKAPNPPKAEESPAPLNPPPAKEVGELSEQAAQPIQSELLPPPWEEQPIQSELPPPWDKPLELSQPLPDNQPNITPIEAETAPMEEPLQQPSCSEPSPPFDSDNGGADMLFGDDYPINTESSENGELKHFSPISPEQWKDAMSRMDFLMAAMLEDAQIKCLDNELVIISSNDMLLENVKGEELEDFQAKLSAVLGMRLHVKIEPSNEVLDAQQEITAVGALLQKARELGVTVTEKE